MTVAEAQQEVRTVFRNGSVGQLVSGAIWLASAALATWGTRRLAILALVLGGAFIFPLTRLVLGLQGKRSSLRPENPLGALAMQVAFTVPLTLPVVGGAALHNINWFYPGAMMVVGAHYLPFVFLYGMWQYALLSGALLAAGLGLGLYRPHAFEPGGWLTGALLVLFSIWFAFAGKKAAPAVAE